MLSKALDYIKLNNMIEKEDRIVAGVSGGADSVCLLYVLRKLCIEKKAYLIVVHINHGIRQEEAARDENFVKEMCTHMGIDFISYSFDVKKLSKDGGLSEEEAGRKVRYDAFIETCRLKKCNKIAIAHNKNDNAETILFNLFRGSGMKGLSGIDPNRRIITDKEEFRIIRPLLSVERKEIEEFLDNEGISYLIDSTNLTEDYSRNKIRNRILTYTIKEINSGAIHNINEAALQLKEALEYMEANILDRYGVLVKETEKEYRVSVHDILAEPVVIRKGIILNILEKLAGKRKDLEAKHVDAVLSLLEKQVGRRIHLPYKIIAERDYEEVKLYILKEEGKEALEESKFAPITIEVPGRVNIYQIMKVIETEIIDFDKNISIPKNSCAKWFDYDKIENAVEIRARKEGDYIQINRLGGTKKLKDYFIDQKIPRKLRDSQILVTDGSHIMWIPGNWDRMSEKYKVDETTKKILLMKMIDLEDK